MEDRVIQQGQDNEVNPWLERMGWHRYLIGSDRGLLMKLVEEPDEEEVSAIWAGMGQMIRQCQQTVATRVGVYMRMEAIRTEKHQIRYQPLQAYQDRESIRVRGRTWQQVVVLIARIQLQRQAGQPRMRLDRVQQQYWRQLLDAVRRPSPTAGDDDAAGDGEGRLSGVTEACLFFCMSLLARTIQTDEYKNPLVCGLIVLGVKERGWKSADEYTPVLSAIIKISRFIVVQIGYQCGKNEKVEEEWEGEKEKEAEEEKSKLSCLQLVTRAMDDFMVRGNYGPVQWMLDLRTYGLKIHYNTTQGERGERGEREGRGGG